MALFASSWLAVTGSLSLVYATTIFPNLSVNSSSELDRQKIAITSDATVISKPSDLG